MASTSTPSAQAAPAKPADVAPDTVIITLDGVCASNSKTGDCKTVVTKAQFDKLLSAINGTRPVTPQQRHKLAIDYSRMLAFSEQAEKEGLDKSAEAQELLRFVRLQVLAEVVNRDLTKKAEPTPDEVQKFYNDNKENYAELQMEKIVVPVRQSGDAGEDTEMKAFAEGLRKRAASGGDFTALQKEASEKAGQQNPPETKVTMSPKQVPQSHQAVTKLKAGEVSEVIQDGTGYYIYKLDKQDYTPFDQVKGQITEELKRQKLKQEQDTISKNATPVLNPDYFGQGPTPAGMRERPVPPGAPGQGGAQSSPAAPPKSK